MVSRRRKLPTNFVSITKVSTIESSEPESVSMSYFAYENDCIGEAKHIDELNKMAHTVFRGGEAISLSTSD